MEQPEKIAIFEPRFERHPGRVGRLVGSPMTCCESLLVATGSAAAPARPAASEANLHHASHARGPHVQHQLQCCTRMMRGVALGASSPTCRRSDRRCSAHAAATSGPRLEKADLVSVILAVSSRTQLASCWSRCVVRSLLASPSPSRIRPRETVNVRQ